MPDSAIQLMGDLSGVPLPSMVFILLFFAVTHSVNLLEGIHNGGEAMSIFPKIKDMPPEKAALARKNLLAYCKLDTYAMVKVWEALVKAVK